MEFFTAAVGQHPFSAVFLLLGKQLLGLFMNFDTTDALTVGITFWLIVSPFFIVVAPNINNND